MLLFQVTATKEGELVTMSSSQPTTPAEHKKKQPTVEQLKTLPVSSGTTVSSRLAENRLSNSRQTPNGLSKLVIEPPPEDEDKLHATNGEDGENGAKSVAREVPELRNTVDNVLFLTFFSG